MMQFDTYNGWENRFTWLIHVHLSNEYELMNEMVELVEQEPNDGSAGHLVEMWVKLALDHWFNFFPGRNKQYDEYIYLLVWDLLRSVFAYADWDALIGMLTGNVETSENLFTLTLFRNIMNNSQLQENVSELVNQASSVYVGVDTVKEWFEAQLDAWIMTPAARQYRNSPISMLAYELVHNTYTVIYWEHIARAFRPGY